MSNNALSLQALIIDDDHSVRQILRAVLAEVGWDVLEAPNGRLGVEAFNQHQPDLVLVDIMMPVMSGLEVCAHIGAEAEQRRVPIIIITALDDTASINQAFDAGALDFISKPLNIRLIRRRLQSLLRATEVEHAIHRAKLEWEATFDVVADCVFVTNDLGQIIRCNRAATQRFGSTYAGLLGRPITTLFFGETQISESDAATFEADVVEVQFTRIPGWYRVSNYPVQLDGQGSARVHVVRDITAQREAEQALRESEERFRALVENLAEGILLLDGAGTIKYTSPAAAHILGYSRSEILGTAALTLVHPAEQAHDQDRFRELIRDPRGRITYQTQVRHKNGTWRWIELTARNALNLAGVNGLVLNYHDITERRQIEESLALQALVLENMAEGVFISDLDGRILHTNRSFDTMFGYAPGELVGQLASVLDLDPLAMSVVGDMMAQVLARGSWTGEIENQRKDGTLIITDNQFSQIDVGGMRYLVGLKSDITERKQTQAWIINTQKLADLGTLAAGVAHELNSPLQVITGVSEGLLRRLDQNTLAPDYLRRNLDVLHRNGWRCAEIVRSLHTYARASGGQLAVANLNELIRDSLLLMEHQLNSWSNITIHTDLAAELPELLCDRNQITQVLINLLTNARDAMPDGGQIAIQTRFEPPTQTIALEVADTGTGIPEAIRTKIFDPFFTTKAIGKGTGLGLSIVAGIIRSYGGDISVDSQPGRGTRFTLQFPVQSPAAVVTASVAPGSGRFDDFGQALLAADMLSPRN